MRSSFVGAGSIEGHRRAVDRISYVILIAGALVMVFPFFWMLVTSFKDMGEVRMWPPSLLPQRWDFTNYRDIWLQYPMAQFLWNGFVIAGLTTVGTLISCSLAGFALAQLNFPGKSLLFLVVLCTILLPYQVRMVPIFIEMATVGWSQQAVDAGEIDVRSLMLPLSGNPRAKMQGVRDGFVKLFCRPGTGIVVGGVVVAPRASELIHPVAIAVSQRMNVDQLAHAFTVYPSMTGSIGEAARRLHRAPDA